MLHYIDIIMTTMASQITSLTVVYSIAYSGADQRKHGHWPLCGEFTGAGEFPTQRASNAENVSIWWRHHVKLYTRMSYPAIGCINPSDMSLCIKTCGFPGVFSERLKHGCLHSYHIQQLSSTSSLYDFYCISLSVSWSAQPLGQYHGNVWKTLW